MLTSGYVMLCYVIQSKLPSFETLSFLTNFRYATFAIKEKKLQEQIERLNNIVRKGNEIKLRDVEIIKEMLSKNAVPTSLQAADIVRYCGNV